MADQLWLMTRIREEEVTLGDSKIFKDTERRMTSLRQLSLLLLH